LTIQGALNKIPKNLNNTVTITVAPGNYSGFVVEGFKVEGSLSAGGAGMIIRGSTQPAFPKTGTPGGTATDCNGGGNPDPNTHSTLIDLNQSWTPHDTNLRGRKLCLMSSAAKGECLTIEDNTSTVITLAGYWTDFHQGWNNCLNGDKYAITQPATHLDRPVSLAQGIGGVVNGQPMVPNIAAILVSDVHAGASGTALNGQPADNFQILIQDFDILNQDANGNPVHSIAFVDSSDHIGFKHFTAGITGGPHPGLYSGSGLFVFRNSTAWTVQSSYANGDAPTTPSSPMISCFRSATADSLVGVFGNVVDNLPAYFGDGVLNQTECHSSVIFGGESLRSTGGDAAGTSPAAIYLESGAHVHFVGTKINGSRINPITNQPFVADCVKLGDLNFAGFGKVYFEGGDFSNCSRSGVDVAGNWTALFINVPTTSAEGANGRFGIEAANGAKVLGLGCASNTQSPCNNGGINPLRGKFDPQNLTFENGPTALSYNQVQNAPGQAITDPQRGGLFSFGFGESTSATSLMPANWISFGQGVVYGFSSQPVNSYTLQASDHVVGMSNDTSRMVTVPGNRPAGSHYVIVDTSGSQNPSHSITISPSSGLINGAPNAVITPGTSKVLELVSDGVNYWIISLK
jgi:hypothetical protein